HPISVYKDPKTEKYQCYSGQRRLAALEKLGHEKVPVIVREPMKPIEAKIRSASENLQRVDLNEKDKADVIRHLYDELGSRTRVARRLGRSLGFINRYLGFDAVVSEEGKKIVSEDKDITVDDAVKVYRVNPKSPEKKIKLLSGKARSEKNIIIETIQENPEASTITIQKEAEEEIERRRKEAEAVRAQREFTIYLPDRYVAGVQDASETLGKKEEDVVSGAVKEWLEEKGFV
ncbi:hypothetical protein AKJ43_03230, partial [candidate division MSBL1 archaeon SCGC-AAA261D19]